MIQFDAVVGNPPYQEDDGGAQKSAKPIYNLFVNMGKRLRPDYLSIIMQITLLDHLIVGAGEQVFSFAEHGLMDEARSRCGAAMNAMKSFHVASFGSGAPFSPSWWLPKRKKREEWVMRAPNG